MSLKLANYKMRRGYQRVLSIIVKNIYQDNNLDLSKSILIVGSARSGTTWLADIIASQGKRRIMFEPFNPDLVPEYSKFDYFQYMRPQEYDQDLFEYCQKVFTGNIRNAWIDREIQYLRPKGRVIKCIRSTLMLRWLDIQFPEVRKLFIIRHPCAVVRSRLKLRWATDDDIHHFLNQPELISDFLEDKMDLIKKAKTNVEKHAIIWCITNLVPLQHFNSHTLNLVKYENLVQHPHEEIPKLFQIIDLSFNDSIYRKMTRPSLTSSKTSAILSRKFTIDQWKEDLSEAQIRNIFTIVDEFGLSYLYKNSEYP